MVRRTGFRIQDSGFSDFEPGVRSRGSSFALALLCFLFCSSLVTRHSSLLFGQQPQAQQGQPLSALNAKYVNGVGPGYWPTAGSGLTLNLSAGTAMCGSPPGPVYYSGGTLTMTASATNYVFLNTSSNCIPASNTTGFTSSSLPLALVAAGTSAITAITDVRLAPGNVAASYGTVRTSTVAQGTDAGISEACAAGPPTGVHVIFDTPGSLVSAASYIPAVFGKPCWIDLNGQTLTMTQASGGGLVVTSNIPQQWGIYNGRINYAGTATGTVYGIDIENASEGFLADLYFSNFPDNAHMIHDNGGEGLDWYHLNFNSTHNATGIYMMGAANTTTLTGLASGNSGNGETLHMSQSAIRIYGGEIEGTKSTCAINIDNTLGTSAFLADYLAGEANGDGTSNSAMVCVTLPTGTYMTQLSMTHCGWNYTTGQVFSFTGTGVIYQADLQDNWWQNGLGLPVCTGSGCANFSVQIADAGNAGSVSNPVQFALNRIGMPLPYFGGGGTGIASVLFGSAGPTEVEQHTGGANFHGGLTLTPVPTPNPPTLQDVGTGGSGLYNHQYCYTTWSGNSYGTTPHSTETCIATANDGNNTHSAVVTPAAFSIGQSHWYVGCRTTGAELQCTPSALPITTPTWTDTFSVTPSSAMPTVNTTALLIAPLAVTTTSTGMSSNTDQAGSITLSSGSGTYYFTQGPQASGHWTVAPWCTVQDQTFANQSSTVLTVNASTLSIQNSVGTGDTYVYHCDPRY